MLPAQLPNLFVTYLAIQKSFGKGKDPLQIHVCIR